MRNAHTPTEAKPPWITTRIKTEPSYQMLCDLVADANLHTLCREPACLKHLGVDVP